MKAIRFGNGIQKHAAFAAMLIASLFTFGTVSHAGPATRGWSYRNTITVNPTAVNFGSLNVGTSSNPTSITVRNGSMSSITINKASLSLLEVSYSGPALPMTLNAGQSFQATLRFSPDAAKSFTGTLAFEESTGRSASVSLDRKSVV